MPMGTATAMKMGVLMLMMSRVETTCRTHISHARTVIGMAMSIVSTSFEKRFTTRPRGVVSKKAMGERKMLASSPLWRNMAPFRLPRDRAREPKRMVSPCPRPRPPYTPSRRSRLPRSWVPSGRGGSLLQAVSHRLEPREKALEATFISTMGTSQAAPIAPK
uniref:Putative secreted protein n=1 Tax=Ixodes ricinus TaxID=34613 RepID=A0A6B0UXH2_IXORI